MFHLQIIKHRKAFYLFSGALVGASILFLATVGLRYGLDFTGGSLLDVTYGMSRPELGTVQEALRRAGIHAASVQPTGGNGYLIRLTEISEEQHQSILGGLRTLAGEGTLTENRFESIGPIIGQELKRRSIYAILFVLLAIIAYLAYAFRKVSRPVASWKFGAAAIIALAHDVLIVVGLFSVLGYLFGTEVDGLFITALLTLLGFSVHDTIVTMDRVRENLLVKQDLTFEEVVNVSINETLTRSINTSLTTLIVLGAIYVFGGGSIRDFSLALIAGIIVGTYSSIFIASPLLVTAYRLLRTRP